MKPTESTPRASVILAHPFPQSFNHAIYQTIIGTLDALGIETFAHDLYEENFNPVLTRSELGKEESADPLVGAYVRELMASTHLIFVHPNWWGQPPAILKGYIDRIIRPPHAYDFPPDATGGGLPIEKLSGLVGVVYNTSNTESPREESVFGDPLETIWKNCIFGFCGITDYHRRMFCVVAESDAGIREGWLSQIREDLRGLFAAEPTNRRKPAIGGP